GEVGVLTLVQCVIEGLFGVRFSLGGVGCPLLGRRQEVDLSARRLGLLPFLAKRAIHQHMGGVRVLGAAGQLLEFGVVVFGYIDVLVERVVDCLLRRQERLAQR